MGIKDKDEKDDTDDDDEDGEDQVTIEELLKKLDY